MYIKLLILMISIVLLVTGCTVNEEIKQFDGGESIMPKRISTMEEKTSTGEIKTVNKLSYKVQNITHCDVIFFQLEHVVDNRTLINCTIGLNKNCKNGTMFIGKILRYNTTENYTECYLNGFSVVFSDGKTYNISNNNCAYYEISPYEQYAELPVISCRPGGLSPLIQQTSKNPAEYDQIGIIYVIHFDSVEPIVVGVKTKHQQRMIPDKLFVTEVNIKGVVV